MNKNVLPAHLISGKRTRNPGMFRNGFILLACLGLLILSACGSENPNNTNNETPTTIAKVNGFGTAANHPHSLLAFQNHALVLATHYGTFFSENAGNSWQQVSGNTDQDMQGLMTYALSKSLLNENRIYMLAQPSLYPYKGVPGVYTSKDQGRTWTLAIKADNLTGSANNMYTVVAGNEDEEQVYLYLTDKAENGLKVSSDGGVHFTDTGTLPFGRLTSLLAPPQMPGILLAGSTDGMARSTDGGKTWKTIKGIAGGIAELVTTGNNQIMYASGDAGIYRSNDAGETFTLVNSQAAYGSLSIAPTHPETVYGRTATSIFRSNDSGQTWTALPQIKGHLYNLAADPENAEQVYLTLEYPTEVYLFEQTTNSWKSLTPKA